MIFIVDGSFFLDTSSSWMDRREKTTVGGKKRVLLHPITRNRVCRKTFRSSKDHKTKRMKIKRRSWLNDESWLKYDVSDEDSLLMFDLFCCWFVVDLLIWWSRMTKVLRMLTNTTRRFIHIISWPWHYLLEPWEFFWHFVFRRREVWQRLRQNILTSINGRSILQRADESKERRNLSIWHKKPSHLAVFMNEDCSRPNLLIDP